MTDTRVAYTKLDQMSDAERASYIAFANMRAEFRSLFETGDSERIAAIHRRLASMTLELLDDAEARKFFDLRAFEVAWLKSERECHATLSEELLSRVRKGVDKFLRKKHKL